jgi:hypothetical protein
MTQIPDRVYHASQRQGLKVIEPRVGTHGQPWVYAAKDLVTASMFLGQHHDFILASGFTNMPYIITGVSFVDHCPAHEKQVGLGFLCQPTLPTS